MPSSKRFSEIRDEARRHPERARRKDEAKERAGEIVSYRIAELRRALGITQAQLAAMIGKSQSAISQPKISTGDLAFNGSEHCQVSICEAPPEP